MQHPGERAKQQVRFAQREGKGRQEPKDLGIGRRAGEHATSDERLLYRGGGTPEPKSKEEPASLHLRYAEGELADYTNKRRMMGPLAAMAHMCDVASARLWFDYPAATGDPWLGAARVAGEQPEAR